MMRDTARGSTGRRHRNGGHGKGDTGRGHGNGGHMKGAREEAVWLAQC